MKSAAFAAFALAVIGLAGAGAPARAQSPSTSSSPSSPTTQQTGGVSGGSFRFGATQLELYVGRYGRDDNPGSESLPLTLRGAAERAILNQEGGQSVTIRIMPGVYHEALTLESRRPTISRAVITVEGAGGEAVLSGGFPFVSPWAAVPGRRGVYRSASTAGFQARPSVRIFVNDESYSYVAREEDLTARRYTVDANRRLVVHTPPNMTRDDLGSARIDIPIRDEMLRVQRGRVVLRNLRVERAGKAGASITGSDVTVERCTFADNVGAGLTVTGAERVSLRQVTAGMNGDAGIRLANCKNVTLTNCETSLNNWGGQEGEQRAGLVLSDVEGARVVGHRAFVNRANGLLTQGTTSGLSVQGGAFAGNVGSGLAFDAATAPTLENALAYENGGPQARATGGAAVTAGWRETPTGATGKSGTVTVRQSDDRVAASVSGARGAITRVVFTDENRAVLGVGARAPFRLGVADLPASTKVTAWAFDRNGNLYRSEALAVTPVSQRTAGR